VLPAGPEMIVILIVAFLVLGPDKLPQAARQAGRVITELRRMSNGFQSELRDAMREPVERPPVWPTPDEVHDVEGVGAGADDDVLDAAPEGTRSSAREAAPPLAEAGDELPADDSAGPHGSPRS
jgi:sec-independent protein translocase protein TatB